MKWRPIEPDPEIIEENKRINREQSELYRSHGMEREEAVKFIIESAGVIEPPVLDVGAGQGWVSVELARRGIKVHAADSSEEMLQISLLNAKSYGVEKLIEYYITDAADLPFRDDYFNLVIMVNVLHHLKDISPVLREISRVIAPGGNFLVSDLTRDGFEILDRISEIEGEVHEVEREYTIDEVGRILPDFGLHCRERDIRFQQYVMLAGKS